MFASLTQLEFDRTSKQAIGFYMSYLLLGISFSAVIGGFAGMLISGDPYQTGLKVGSNIAIFICTMLALLIAYKKAIFLSFKVLLIIVIALVLAISFGFVGGLIPVAYLTTIHSKGHRDEGQ